MALEARSRPRGGKSAAAGRKLERKGSEAGANTREAILAATEIIMAEEGYAAVTSRRVAEKAGLKSQLVHYYFGTMDDLFVAVYERSEKEFRRRHLQAVSSDNPLRALWDLSVHPKRTRLSQEFIALSNRRESMRKITARVLEQTHSINAAFISRYLQEAGLDLDEYPPIVISCIINGLSRSLINEESMGVSLGHAEVLAFAERWLSRLEAMHRAAPGSGPRRAVVGEQDI
jgi:AcrR family transcriptional regulator